MYGTLACPACGGLVYSERLNEIAAEAQREEMSSPIRAALIWKQALPLLPPDSQQYRWVTQRIGALSAGTAVQSPYVLPGAHGYQPSPAAVGADAAVRPRDPLGLALAKTIGSMIISIVVYTMMFSKDAGGLRFGLEFATGFVLLMLVHEMGHVFAMRFYGLSASPPIFIPFLGALINLRQSPRNALEEAIVGIGGPVLGTVGAVVTYFIYLKTGSQLFYELAMFGFLLNLFNMLPVPPLDGGRVTAAVSPWIWIPGLLVAAYLLIFDSFNPILILLLVMAWPRVRRTLLERAHHSPYYDIGLPAKIAMGAAYVLLGGFLAVMWYLPVIRIAFAKMNGQI